MEEGLIAGFNLAISAVAAGALLGIVSSVLYSALWFVRDSK